MQLEAIDLRGENKVAFGEPVNLVRPDRDPDLSPGQRDIRMMPLIFSKISDLIHKAQCRLEIRKGQLPLEMVVVNNLPVRNLTLQRTDLSCCQGWYSAPAGDACFFCES